MQLAAMLSNVFGVLQNRASETCGARFVLYKNVSMKADVDFVFLATSDAALWEARPMR